MSALRLGVCKSSTKLPPVPAEPHAADHPGGQVGEGRVLSRRQIVAHQMAVAAHVDHIGQIPGCAGRGQRFQFTAGGHGSVHIRRR